MYDDTVEYILNIPKFTKKNTLDNTKALLRKLGNPEKNIKIIHVAGTNGKGSVCNYCAGILTEAGYKTGLFTSPHLQKINERIKVNGLDISDESFTDCFNEVIKATKQIIKSGYYHPTFFEFIFAIAMASFAKENVEYAILETGLGGRLDATNVISEPELTIITQIDYDHMEYLGNTLEEIAIEKSGIIKDRVPLVFLDENKASTKVIETVAKSKNATICKIIKDDVKIIKKQDKKIDFYPANGYYESNVFSINSEASYQAVNASLAIAAMNILKAADVQAIRRGLKKSFWEGRMEEVADGVYVDGAHNPAAVKELVKNAKDIWKNRKLYVLFSVVKDKDFYEMIEELSTLDCEKIIITKLDCDRTIELSQLHAQCKKRGLSVCCRDSIEEAFETGINLKGEEGVLLCFGSLYLVGSIKNMLRRNKND